MKERGALITRVQDASEAVAALAAEDFDVAIVDMKAPGGGTALVKAVKAGVRSTNPLAHLVESEMAAVDGRELVTADQQARRRHRLTPFFLVMEGERQYAIVVEPPEHSYLEDGNGLSLPDAVMCLDVSKLLLRGPALA